MLTTTLNAKSVADVMFQHDALTIKELSLVQENKTQIKSAECLLNIMLQIPEPHVFNFFLKILKELNQHHNVQFLARTRRYAISLM